jgi:hypothetical protein
VRALGLAATIAIVAACRFEQGSVASDASTGGADGATAGGDGSMGSDGGGNSGFAFVGAQTAGSTLQDTIIIPSTATGGATYVLGVASKGYRETGSVVGLGATWTPIGDQCGARSETGVALYVGRGATTDGFVVVTLEAAPINAAAVLAVYVGTSSNGGTAKYNAVDGSSCSAGGTPDIDSYSFDITGTSSSGHVVAMIATRGVEHSPGSGLVQRVHHEVGIPGDVAGVAVVDGTVTDIAGTFDSDVDVAAVAIELR